MNKIVYGVNSAVPATTKLSNGYTLFDWVMRQNGFPAFWGRPISGKNKVSAEEIELLHSKNCKLAPIFDDLTENGIATPNGTKDALRAAAAARELGIPAHKGITLFVAIPSDWAISHNWMISFAAALNQQGYLPGFMANTDSSKNFNFGRHCSHFVRATGKFGYYGASFWATEPKQSDVPTKWAPYCPSALTPEKINFWQCGKLDMKEASIQVSYAQDKSKLNCMW